VGKRRRQALSTAQLEAQAKYGPQEQAVRDALAQLGIDLKGGISQEHGIRRVLQASNRAQIPGVRSDYASVDATRNAAQAQLARDFGPLGPAAAPYAAAAAVERAGGRTRSSESRAGAVGEFRARIADAASGEAGAIRNLRAQYASQSSTQRRALSSLSAAKGAFTIAEFAKLLDQAKRDAQQRRGQNITLRGQNLAHQDRLAALRLRARSGGKKGKSSKLPLASSAKAIGQVGLAQSYFEKLHGHLSTHQIYSVLRTGYKTKSGSKIPQIDRNYINAGADLHFLGGRLSPTNYRRLKHLGVRVPSEWKPRANFGIRHGTSPSYLR
jgi:hypothetical protein